MLNLAVKRNTFFFMLQANLYLKRNEQDLPRMILIPAFILVFFFFKGRLLVLLVLMEVWIECCGGKIRELKGYILKEREAILRRLGLLSP